MTRPSAVEHATRITYACVSLGIQSGTTTLPAELVSIEAMRQVEDRAGVGNLYARLELAIEKYLPSLEAQTKA